MEQALQASEERLRLAAQAAHFGIHDYDAVLDRSLLSPELHEITGVPPGTEIHLDTIIQMVHPEDRERVSDAIQASLDPRGNGRFEQEFRIRRLADGELRWIYNRSGTLFSGTDSNRKPLRNVGVVIDVTERKRTEEELEAAREQIRQDAQALEKIVQRRTAQLHESLRSMENLLYTIAHDLRAPLRAMEGFTRALQEDYGDKFDDAARDYTDRIVKASHRMDRLIGDLLSFGRLSVVELPCTKVELGPVIHSALLQSHDTVLLKNAEVTVREPLPPVLANKSALNEIFHHLIANALTFVAPAVRPKVDVFAEQLGAIVRVTVQDNGIGIAPEHQERIFQMFHRLEVDDEYPGTGLGLAVVKKAVERMHGRVGVQSDVGAGSRFWFELPAPAQ